MGVIGLELLLVMMMALVLARGGWVGALGVIWKFLMLGMFRPEDVEIVQYLTSEIGRRNRNHVYLFADFESFCGSFLLVGAQHWLGF